MDVREFTRHSPLGNICLAREAGVAARCGTVCFSNITLFLFDGIARLRSDPFPVCFGVCRVEPRGGGKLALGLGDPATDRARGLPRVGVVPGMAVSIGMSSTAAFRSRPQAR